jgi:hypothetical protein
MLCVMQVSHDEDSYEYSFDEFAGQCDQLGLSSIDKSKSGTLGDDSYSVEDDFESPQKEAAAGEYSSSRDREQSVKKAKHPRQPVPKSTTPIYHPEDLQQAPPSKKRVDEDEQEDQYFVVTIVATPLDAYPTPDTKSNCQDEKISGVCSPTPRVQNQEDRTETLHCEHTTRPASSISRCSYDADTKSIKIKKAESSHSAERKSKKVSCYSVERLAQLSKPVERRSSHEDDTKTTQKPKKASLDTSKDGPSFVDFLERMECKEAERKEKAQRASAKALYDAKVDKVISCAASPVVSSAACFLTRSPRVLD